MSTTHSVTHGPGTKKFLANPENRRHYERARLETAITEELLGLMERKGLSRADLARMLGLSKSRMTQIFSGEHSLTLGTVADAFLALGYTLTVQVKGASKTTRRTGARGPRLAVRRRGMSSAARAEAAPAQEMARAAATKA